MENILCHHRSRLIVLALLSAAVVNYGMEIETFNVPRYANLRSDVSLECSFRLTHEFERLHSIKWYRTSSIAGGEEEGKMLEFYSYSHNRDPRAKWYKRNGIKVDINHSSIYKVVLRRVNLNTTGIYRCEVTTRPDSGFDVKVRESRMEIVALPRPQEKPHITGGLPNYHMGDQVEVNCTSPRTFPPTRLKWLINGQEITRDKSMLIDYPVRKVSGRSGLFRTRLGLSIRLQRSLFDYGQIKLECVGEVGGGGRGTLMTSWDGGGGGEGVRGGGGGQRQGGEQLQQGQKQTSAYRTIETIRLPEALISETKQVYFVPITSGSKICASSTVSFLIVLHILIHSVI